MKLNPTLPTPNIIFLETVSPDTRNNTIEHCVNVASKRMNISDDELRSLFRICYDQATIEVGEKILQKQILKNLEIIDELKKI